MIYTVDTDAKIVRVPTFATLSEIVQAFEGVGFAFEDYEILREIPDQYRLSELKQEEKDTDSECNCTKEDSPSLEPIINHLKNTSADGFGIGVRVTSEQLEKIMEALKNG